MYKLVTSDNVQADVVHASLAFSKSPEPFWKNNTDAFLQLRGLQLRAGCSKDLVLYAKHEHNSRLP